MRDLSDVRKKLDQMWDRHEFRFPNEYQQGGLRRELKETIQCCRQLLDENDELRAQLKGIGNGSDRKTQS